MTTHEPLSEETPSLTAAVPPHLLEGLRAYAIDHRPVGQFLTSVLENDLMKAIGRADVESLAAIRGIVQFVYNAMPGPCHGSPAAVKAWLAKGEANESLPRDS